MSQLAGEVLPLAEGRVRLRADGSVQLALQPGNNTEGVKRLRKTDSYYRRRGPTVAVHLSAELGIDEDEVVRPWHAALASAVAFTVGGMAPLAAIPLSPQQWRVPWSCLPWPLPESSARGSAAAARGALR
jgi:hypothetical protein